MVLIIRIKRNIVSLLIIVCMFGNTCSASAANVPVISADSAVIMCEGRPLYSKNAAQRRPMASTTKLMTAIIAIEEAAMDDEVSIEWEHCNIEGSSMYLKPETKVSVLQLIKGLLLVSGNDAALALADHVAGSSEKFAKLMNKKAKSLGMDNTNFVNPHGLNHPSHYSTAEDMAKLMEYCMENELFRELIALKSFKSDGAQLLNHNKLLFVCEGCAGGKTGYTKAAGRCLVSACEREGQMLVCVTLSAPDDWNDHMALYDWCYSRYSLRSATENISFSVPLVSEKADDAAVLVPQCEMSVFVEDNCDITLEGFIPWFSFKPIEKGKIGGRVVINVDGKSLGEYYLIYSEDEY